MGKGKPRRRAAQRAAGGLSSHVPAREIEFLKKGRQQGIKRDQSPPPAMLRIGEGKRAKTGHHEGQATSK